MRRKQWQWHLLTMRRQTVKTKAMHRLVAACSTKYRNGFVTNVQQGDVPSRYESVARYLATDVVRPPISLRRIDGHDGQRVTSHYRSHKTERVERERVEVSPFIGSMLQHTLAKGFNRIRSYGVQATKTFAKMKGRIHEAVAKLQGVVKGAVKSIARRTSRQRSHQRSGRDPLLCQHCHEEMGLWKSWHPP